MSFTPKVIWLFVIHLSQIGNSLTSCKKKIVSQLVLFRIPSGINTFGAERNFVVLLCEKNVDPVGYILLTPGKGSMTYAKIQQIVVRNDARRLDYGSALLAVARNFCETFGLRGFTLRCRTDLESNFFWQALGFLANFAPAM